MFIDQARRHSAPVKRLARQSHATLVRTIAHAGRIKMNVLSVPNCLPRNAKFWPVSDKALVFALD